MLTYCIRRRLFVSCRVTSNMSALHELLELCKQYGTSSAGGPDPACGMVQLLERRFFIPPGHPHAASLLQGQSCAYGPLGLDLKRNLLEQWWSSVVRSRPLVFGISTLHGVGAKGAGDVQELLRQRGLTKEQLGEKVQELLQRRQPLRTSLLQGGWSRREVRKRSQVSSPVLNLLG